MLPAASVIIVNYNSGACLQRCVDCLNNQTVQPADIVLIDNASTDSSIATLNTYNLCVRVIPQTSNLGFAAANNVAIRACPESEWLVLLNPDAYPRTDWYANLMQGINRYVDASMFACRLMQANDPQRVDGAGDVFHTSGLAWRRGHGRIDVGQFNRDDEVFAPCAAAGAYRRDTVTALGGFDEDYFCYFEDVDLALRMRLAGHRCIYLSAALVDHVGSAITGKGSDFSVYHGHRNLVWTYLKNMPPRLFWWYLPQHLLMNIATIIRFSFRGQGRTILKSKWHAIKAIRHVLKKRHATQNLLRELNESRTASDANSSDIFITNAAGGNPGWTSGWTCGWTIASVILSSHEYSIRTHMRKGFSALFQRS